MGQRSLSTALAEMEKLSADSAKLQSTLPDALKPIAESVPGIAATMKAEYDAAPDLYKMVEAKISEADVPGVRATVDVPKAPHSCKYTEEGTAAHFLMQRIAKVDRRMKSVSEIEITLSAADKAQLEAEYKEEALKEIAGLEAEGLKDLSPDLSALPKAPDTMRIA